MAVADHTLYMYATIERSKKWQPVLILEEDDVENTRVFHNKRYRTRSQWDYDGFDIVVRSCFPIDKIIRRSNPQVPIVLFNQGPSYFVTHSALANNKLTTMMDNEWPVDVIWATPHYNWQGDFIKEMMGASASSPAPYVWEPDIFETRGALSSPGDRDRVGVYETNRGIYKMSLMPMLIVEKAHREKPLAHAEAYGLGRLDTDAFRKHVLSGFEAPWKTSKSMAKLPQQWSDIGTVVSHQVRCGLNNLWLEALHSGLALVHNSEHMPEGCGYYYPGENVTAGAEALRRAVETHDAVEAERQRQRCLWPFSTSNPANVEWYERLLDETLPEVRPKKCSEHQTIPQKMHFIWMQKNLLVDTLTSQTERDNAKNVRAIADMNPEYETNFYDDAACQRECRQTGIERVPELYEAMRGATSFGPSSWANMANVCRLAILYNHGGVYMDTNMAMRLPFKAWLREDVSFVAPMSVCKLKRDFFNSLLGASPGHNAMRFALERMLQDWDGKQFRGLSTYYSDKKPVPFCMNQMGTVYAFLGWNETSKQNTQLLDERMHWRGTFTNVPARTIRDNKRYTMCNTIVVDPQTNLVPFYSHMLQRANCTMVDEMTLQTLEKMPVAIHTIPRIVWTYWHSKEMPPLVISCIKTWRRFLKGWDIRIVHKESVSEYLNENEDFPPTLWEEPYIAHQADMIRFALIRKYGGVWLDATTIIRANMLDTFRDRTTDWFGYGNGTPEIFAFASPKGGRTITKFHKRMLRVMNWGQDRKENLEKVFNITVAYTFPQRLLNINEIEDPLPPMETAYILIRELRKKQTVTTKRQFFDLLFNDTSKLPPSILAQPLLKLNYCEDIDPKNALPTSWWNQLTQ